MKKILYLLLVSLFVFTSCNQEEEIIDVALKAKPIKTTICHYNPHNDTWKTIEVNEKQLAKHLEHGDRRAPCGYTYVPDELFEKYLIYYGYDDILDKYVLTSNIETITELSFSYGDNGPVPGTVGDLTGIEDFVALSILRIDGGISEIDLSKNTNLTSLQLGHPVDGGTYSMTSLDLTNNILLNDIFIKHSSITSLDFSNNALLKHLWLEYNDNLTSLNLKNGNNSILTSPNFMDNPLLTCVQVDDVEYSNANWRFYNTPLAFFSEDCSLTYTYVPDDHFERHLIYFGYDDILDNYVLTSNITTVTDLWINAGDDGPDELRGFVNDLTGIEDFIALSNLSIIGGGFEDLDLSKNTNLTDLILGTDGPFHTLYNITSLDLTNNVSLDNVAIYDTNITSLDFSNNSSLRNLILYRMNDLVSLNLKNGNNTSLALDALGNDNLSCIQVDDAVYSTANWSSAYTYSEDCGY